MTNTNGLQQGAYQRHLARRENNPLFPPPRRHVDAEQRELARQHDREALTRFLDEFQGLVQRCVELKASEESEVVLELKAQLDRAYVISAGLMGEQREVQQGLLRLSQLVMAAIQSGAANDPLALEELRNEAVAREKNIELLRHPLVADLMNPDSPIPGDELVPTLLSSDEVSLAAALWLFEQGQLERLREAGEKLLQSLEATGVQAEGARRALAVIEQACED